MKTKISIRNVLSAITLATVGITLLLLVISSTSFANFINPIGLIVHLYTLIPFLVVATLLSFMISGTHNRKRVQPANSKKAKVLSILAITSIFVGLISNKFSTINVPYNQTRAQFVLENIGTGAIFLAFIFAVVLINLQQYIYWPLWSRADQRQADERQLLVRQRLFEKSYRYIIYVILASMLLVGFGAERMHKIAPFLIIFVVASMPAIVAAWQKDS